MEATIATNGQLTHQAFSQIWIMSLLLETKSTMFYFLTFTTWQLSHELDPAEQNVSEISDVWKVWQQNFSVQHYYEVQKPNKNFERVKKNLRKNLLVKEELFIDQSFGNWKKIHECYLPWNPPEDDTCQPVPMSEAPVNWMNWQLHFYMQFWCDRKPWFCLPEDKSVEYDEKTSLINVDVAVWCLVKCSQDFLRHQLQYPIAHLQKNVRNSSLAICCWNWWQNQWCHFLWKCCITSF